ncbi:MAG: type I DNA topoisomerase [Candidatus Omnitrophica bacterium]|nr:type I DNA topoisomerase [Candidatus Omnitrophota bacterium]
MKNKNLVIVESPTKAKTIGKILGGSFSVYSSMGHIIDLPKTELGVDIEQGFAPRYVVISQRRKVLTALKKEAKDIENIYMATDPDREGEAIGWNIKEKLFKDRKVLRVVFHEITPTAIKDSFANPREFDLNMIEAQIGRRVLDRLVGYFLSPLLWKKITRGLSAGRVQSVALRLIIEREREIQKFVPQEYWEVQALFEASEGASFTAKLEKIGEQKAEIRNGEEASLLAEDLRKQEFSVKSVKQSEKKRYPDPPFTTSTLQQEAFNKLKFNAKKTMLLAQQLYEGIDIGEESPVGLITYMRTDSTQVAPEAIKEVRNLISSLFSPEHLPETPNTYKVKKLVQAAHEAIRPSLIMRPAESLEKFLQPDQYKLYELIYRRFVASQMTPARSLVVSVAVQGGKYVLNASGTTMIFDGFTAVYNRQKENGAEAKPELPALTEGQALKLVNIDPSQHFTKPPARFSDSSIVKILEEEGIGRPSTYVPIISTLVTRGYVHRIKGYFEPTELGCKVCDLLVEYFPKVMDVKFTALMEEELDQIEEGKIDRMKVLEDFYQPFKTSIEFAHSNIKKEVITTDEVCELCGKPMVIKWGRKGKFLSCSGFPECKFSKSITTGIKCPQPGCAGELVERRSRRGPFYGCSTYPKCTFITTKLPEEQA